MPVDTMEARAWLKSSQHPEPLAPSRFPDAGEALDFVYKLYRAGAIEVSIDGLDASEDAPAHALLIEIPDEPDQRSALFDICNHESSRLGDESQEDNGQSTIRLDWH